MLQLIRDLVFPKAYDFRAKPRARSTSPLGARPSETAPAEGEAPGTASHASAK